MTLTTYSFALPTRIEFGPGISFAQGAQSFDRIGRAGAGDFQIAAQESRWRHGQAHHFHARPPAGARPLVRRVAYGEKEHAIQAELALGKLRHCKMRVMHRIKRAAQNPDCQW